MAAAVPGGHPPEVDAETHGHGGPHEVDWWMRGPLVGLAIPAVLAGFWGSPLGGNGFQRFLEGPAFRDSPANLPLAIGGAVLALAGIGVAWSMYGARVFVTEPLVRLGGIYTVLAQRYYIDEFYMWLIDKLMIGVSYGLSVFDREILDGLVNGIAGLFRQGGSVLRVAQTGRVQNYGLVLFAGLAVITLVLVAVPLVRQ